MKGRRQEASDVLRAPGPKGPLNHFTKLIRVYGRSGSHGGTEVAKKVKRLSKRSLPKDGVGPFWRRVILASRDRPVHRSTPVLFIVDRREACFSYG